MLKLDFTNQVAVITGGSGGIGLTTAKLFVEAGGRVVCVDMRPPEEALANCRFIKADVSDFSAVRECINNILAGEKAVDCLINNAGISRDAPVWKMDEAAWDAVINVNLKGAFNFIHYLAPHFRERQHGKIVNVSSINGLRGKFGLANYAASKAGLIGLTKTVAKELGRYNVNVNAVAPGYILTTLTQNLPQQILDQAQSETVLGRLGQPEDVASTILFLCSEWARHITGEVIKVDGGQYI
ncbi:MAG: SDR family oxidoreductase [candidate division KSB1 bacterium]|nr:SDR family oxidoreductase [candidate division KSB1 bacterium]MDZ7274244.1 SDR family oxidoreductase [candidate division KSB1 bacterium]MDZ7287234.1 SDR family oxidoreductase [candidate division KSB1 bacterium]MDZ7296842.1 SDR family oxidoreductase [candidate division KSB1 bacterium]MDZ7306054.1 SDR family oxidoreductase [candidate division KSB1 bacterium]